MYSASGAKAGPGLERSWKGWETQAMKRLLKKKKKEDETLTRYCTKSEKTIAEWHVEGNGLDTRHKAKGIRIFAWSTTWWQNFLCKEHD